MNDGMEKRMNEIAVSKKRKIVKSQSKRSEERVAKKKGTDDSGMRKRKTKKKDWGQRSKDGDEDSNMMQ